MYVWMDGWMDGWMDPDGSGWIRMDPDGSGWIRMDADGCGWMHPDGWMDGCMHACMYGPVSRVPESVSLGDHSIGGGARDPESGLIYTVYVIYGL